MLRDPKAEARIARQLAPRKLTAKQLGVTPKFLRAFDEVLRMFKSGEVELLNQLPKKWVPGKWFNISTWGGDECCSVHCIGGWCQIEMGIMPISKWGESWERLFLADGHTRKQFLELRKLFYPESYQLGEYTVAQAISAMESWRSTGKTVWPR